jgi:hypothetical protein
MAMRRLRFGVGVLAALMAVQGPGVMAYEQPSVTELRAEVGRRQRERDEAALAEAKGRLALAEGRKEDATAEFRKVVSYREARLKALLARPGMICDPHILVEAKGQLAVARARVAEAEGDLERLAALLPDVVSHYRSRIDRDEKLLRARVVRPEEVRGDFRKLNRELQAARDRLDEVRGQLARNKGGKGKP